MVMESSGLDATRDARAIVRLFQCSMCSRPLQRPASLPCGNTVCFTCLPQLHERQNISYPNTPDRQLGLLCPFEQCGIEHATGDFNVDFTLKRVLDTVGSELQRFMPFDDDTSVVMEESIDRFHDSDRYSPKSAVLPGGRLAATYSLAATGSLPYDMELSYRSASGEDVSHMDKAILCHLREKVRPELQCLVCYTLYLDPITTSCGHTFCRKCLERVLDHSQSCPICRKVQHVSTTFLQFQPSNRQLTDLLIGLFPDDLAQRAALASAEDKVGASELSLPTPLFVCTLSFPKMPTFLHIFEPRYRLMIRRAWQGDRRFGMVLPNRTGESQGELGDDCTFLQFGTLLEIKSYQLLPDGRSWIETVGISRFRVKRWGYRDDYIVSDVETVDDLPISEEETMEALETSTSTSYSTPPSETWGSLSTQQLLEIAQGFVNRMQSTSAPWLHQRVINIYGPPPQDASTFPYWLASVLPITEPEKYRLLSCSSVRERLKIIVGWIKRIEDQQW
ncbi:PUA-like domain-containing protein [Peziza echinospora]|nr:PUA-like domain-containing protein [Peziza echinospora]